MTATEYHEFAQKYAMRLETGSDGVRFYWLPGSIASKEAKEVKKTVMENSNSGLRYGLGKGGDNQFHLIVTAPASWY